MCFILALTSLAQTAVAQTGFKLLVIFLSQSPKCLDYICEPPHLFNFVFKDPRTFYICYNGEISSVSLDVFDRSTHSPWSHSIKTQAAAILLRSP